VLDGVSLDQVRTFLAAADEGSFSAAGRRLGRAQSVVSQTLANLEAQLEVKLFDRSARYPVLTDAGRALLADARAVAQGMSGFKARARALAGGLESELSIAVDVMFPIEVLAHAVSGFQVEFPDTPLRVEVEALGAVLQPVLDGRCAFAVAGSLPDIPPQLTQEYLVAVPFVLVAGATHPLAQIPGSIPQDRLAEHVQLVLSDRSKLSEGREFGVLSPKTWRLADLGAKHAFLRYGLGWGSMPRTAVQADLDSGALIEIESPGWTIGLQMQMRAVHRSDSPPGPAGRWLVERLKETVNRPSLASAKDDPASSSPSHEAPSIIGSMTPSIPKGA
jgi:DNA-binding transcriptional LysR family regulator